MTSQARRILVLYWYADKRPMRLAIAQHLRALQTSPIPHEVLYHNVAEPFPSWVAAARFDAVILHTTLLCLRWSTEYAVWRERLRLLETMRAVKIALPQDEYDHSAILDDWLAELRVDAILSNFPAAHHPLLYPKCHKSAEISWALTGYIDQATAQQLAPTLKPIAQRKVDIVYRACHLPYQFGSHGQLKHEVGTIVGAAAHTAGLRCDISTDDSATIVGPAWFRFLANGRAAIGCESGSSVLDPRGAVAARINELLAKQPKLSFAEVSANMPPGWDDYRFFAVSPRHFEAVVTKTCQVLVEGEYDGIFIADEHYLAIKRDFSNLAEVLDRLKDHRQLQRMVDRAYEDICASGNYTYARLAATIETALEGARRNAFWPWKTRARSVPAPASSAATLPLTAAVPPRHLLRLAWAAWWQQRGVRGLFFDWLTCGKLRRAIRFTDLMADSAILHLILGAHRQEIAVQMPFALRVRWDAEQQTVEIRSLSSRFLASDGQARQSDLSSCCACEDWVAISNALTTGAVRQVIWNHFGFGQAMVAFLSRHRRVTIRLGASSVYAFPALAAAAGTQPAALKRRLAQILHPKGITESRAEASSWFTKLLIVRQTFSRVLAWRFCLSLVWSRSVRQQFGWTAAIRETIRYMQMIDMQHGTMALRVEQQFTEAGSERDFALVPCGLFKKGPPVEDMAWQEALPPSGGQLFWDHRGLGEFVLRRRGTRPTHYLPIKGGKQNRYHFRAWSALMQVNKPVALRFLAGLLQAVNAPRRGLAGESDPSNDLRIGQTPESKDVAAPSGALWKRSA